MCLILHEQAGKRLDVEYYRNALDHNSHGFGWAEIGKDGILTGRVVPKDGKWFSNKEIDKLARQISRHDQLERILHFRFATNGAKTVENTHPFEVRIKEYDSLGYLAHNGVFTQYSYDANISDTRLFISRYLIPYAKSFEGDVESALMQTAWQVNKIAYLNAIERCITRYGTFTTFADGIFASNTYSLDSPYDLGQTGYYSKGVYKAYSKRRTSYGGWGDYVDDYGDEDIYSRIHTQTPDDYPKLEKGESSEDFVNRLNGYLDEKYGKVKRLNPATPLTADTSSDSQEIDTTAVILAKQAFDAANASLEADLNELNEADLNELNEADLNELNEADAGYDESKDTECVVKPYSDGIDEGLYDTEEIEVEFKKDFNSQDALEDKQRDLEVFNEPSLDGWYSADIATPSYGVIETIMHDDFEKFMDLLTKTIDAEKRGQARDRERRKITIRF